MKQTINKTQFTSTMREIRPNNFSGPGLEALFDFLEELENDIGEESEFDPIALCCEWSEMNEKEIRQDYGVTVDFSECEDLDDIAEVLNDETMVIETGNDTLLFLQF